MSIETYFASQLRRRPEGLVSRFSDLFLVFAVAAIIALMILPLPTIALDCLIALNIVIGLMLLMVSIYIASPIEFSVFPSLLLLTTLYRLSLSIATTRMILVHGHAGHIIDTFGGLVAGGNLVVGCVVFLIITIVQFMVIAKGAERVAEVAARFSLDAMPGKQLSIDADLRAGMIDKDEARRRRRTLELESKLHGSLDGAMKFVKGDAMAGIIIVVVNIIGGLTVGMLQQHMDIGQAATTYSILTIGDGLVTQIPALLGAMSAGLIVTRTADGDQEKHLGDAVRLQLSRKPKVFLMAGGLCWAMALVPGFPWPVFFVMGAVLLGTGVSLDPSLRAMAGRRLAPAIQAAGRTPAPRLASASTRVVEARPMLPLLLEVSGEGAARLDGLRLGQVLEAMQERFELDLGVTLPRLSFQPGGEEGALRWRLLAYEAPIGEGAVEGADPVAALTEAVRQSIRRNIGVFMGIQEASVLLTRAGADYPEVVKEAARALPLARIAEVFRRLVEEEIPIRNLRDILEALADVGQREKDVFALTEFGRIALKRQICSRHAQDGRLRAVTLDPALEEQLRGAVHVSGGVQQLALDPTLAAAILANLRHGVAKAEVSVILTHVDLRRHVRKLIEPDLFDTAVLSFHELAPTLKLDIVDRIAAPRPDVLLVEAA